MLLDDALREMPLIAILRGLTPDAAPSVAETLIDAGFRCIEVPLNRPHALDALQALSKHAGASAAIGAGTVLTPEAAQAASDAGGAFVVSPNVDVAVLRGAKVLNMPAIPGVFTPSEAFVAVREGAAALKLFPAEAAGPSTLKSLLDVLPEATRIFPVGGIALESMRSFFEAGAAGFGFGGSLWTPGMSIEELRERAHKLSNTMKELRRPSTSRS